MSEPDAKDYLDIELLKLRVEALEEWKAWATGVMESLAAVLVMATDTQPEEVK